MPYSNKIDAIAYWKEYNQKRRAHSVCNICGKTITIGRSLCMSCSKLNKLNPMWKGDAVGYSSLHEWIRSNKLKPKLCEICKKQPPYDLANISGNYMRNTHDFQWLCRSCHMASDGRLLQLIKQSNHAGNNRALLASRNILGQFINNISAC
jgi:hypothetical protein